MGRWSKPAVRCNLIGHAAEFAAGSGKKHAAGNLEHESGRRQDAEACPGDSERPAMKLRWPWRKKREGWTCKKIQLFYHDYVDDELSVCDKFDYEVHSVSGRYRPLGAMGSDHVASEKSFGASLVPTAQKFPAQLSSARA